MPPLLSETLAERLRASRLLCGLTQAEVAERCGLAVEAYGRLERGLALPRADTLVALAKTLRASSDHLLGLDDSPTLVARDGGEPDEQLRRLSVAGERLSPASQRALIQFLRSLPAPGARQRRRS